MLISFVLRDSCIWHNSKNIEFSFLDVRDVVDPQAVDTAKNMITRSPFYYNYRVQLDRIPIQITKKNALAVKHSHVVGEATGDDPKQPPLSYSSGL